MRPYDAPSCPRSMGVSSRPDDARLSPKCRCLTLRGGRRRKPEVGAKAEHTRRAHTRAPLRYLAERARCLAAGGRLTALLLTESVRHCTHNRVHSGQFSSVHSQVRVSPNNTENGSSSIVHRTPQQGSMATHARTHTSSLRCAVAFTAANGSGGGSATSIERWGLFWPPSRLGFHVARLS